MAQVKPNFPNPHLIDQSVSSKTNCLPNKRNNSASPFYPTDGESKPFLDAMEFEPIFVCLAKIVQNFVDENTRIGKPNI
ncbi:unnamed protein product, partial [Brassica oleracea var. botrytis]